MFYYKFRYTFDKDTYSLEYKKQYMRSLIDILEDYIEDGRYTAGLERFGKTGEEVKHHMHIHFKSTKQRDTIAKQIIRKVIGEEDFRKKSQIYSLRPEADVNEDRFYRYPLKETKLEDKCILTKGFTEDEVKTMNEVAYASRQIQYEVNQNKTSKKEDITFYDKMSAYLDSKGTYSTEREVFLEILNFYLEQDKPLSRKSIQEYTYLYMVKKKIMTPEEFYNLKYI